MAPDQIGAFLSFLSAKKLVLDSVIKILYNVGNSRLGDRQMEMQSKTSGCFIILYKRVLYPIACVTALVTILLAAITPPYGFQLADFVAVFILFIGFLVGYVFN